MWFNEGGQDEFHSLMASIIGPTYKPEKRPIPSEGFEGGLDSFLSGLGNGETFNNSETAC